MLQHIIFAALLVLLCLTSIHSVTDAVVYRESIIELKHFISDIFITRGRYVIKHKFDGSHEISVIDSPNNGISSTQLAEFKGLLTNNGLYRIQVVSIMENGAVSTVSTAIPVCDLQQSGFKEDVVLHLDNNDNIVSVSYTSPIMAITQPCNANKVCTSKNQNVLLS